MSNTGPSELVDRDARRRIEKDLSARLAVDAGDDVIGLETGMAGRAAGLPVGSRLRYGSTALASARSHPPDGDGEVFVAVSWQVPQLDLALERLVAQPDEKTEIRHQNHAHETGDSKQEMHGGNDPDESGKGEHAHQDHEDVPSAFACSPAEIRVRTSDRLPSGLIGVSADHRW